MPYDHQKWTEEQVTVLKKLNSIEGKKDLIFLGIWLQTV